MIQVLIAKGTEHTFENIDSACTSQSGPSETCRKPHTICALQIKTQHFQKTLTNLLINGSKIRLRRLPEKALSEFDYYMDTHKLRITVSNMKNANSEQELLAMRDTILQNLGSLPPVPSVQFAPIAPKHDLVRIPRLCHRRTLCPSLGMVLEASELRMF